MSKLENVKVLDLTRLLPGAICSLYLADMGADVLKVEDTEMGDYLRWIPPMRDGRSIYFSILNRNKKSMKLNLKKDKGVKIFLKLIEKYDVVIDSFRPGVLDKLGIGYSIAKEINPKIIYCSITGFGQTGPYKDMPGHDINYIGYSGILELCGERNSPPHLLPVQLADIAGGSLSAVISILCALYSRSTSGLGCNIDISITDCTIPFLSLIFGKYFYDNILPKRGQDDLTGKFICYNVYKTKDEKYIALGALEPKFWINFCKEIKREDLIDKQFVTGDEFEKYHREVENIFLQKTQKEWEEFFKGKDVCCTPVLDLQQVVKNEHVISRGLILEDEKTKEKYIPCPIKFSDMEIKNRLPAPEHGEHTVEILTELGYTDEEIEKFKIEKII